MNLPARAFMFCLLLGAPATSASKPVVIVELFTSEGCSSCPPADLLLAELSGREVSGADVVVLSEHVDYWNHLGWRDPFSSPVFSARQQAYGELFKLQTVFTPQIIVDGLSSLDAASDREVRRMIAYAAEQPKAAVSIERKEDGRVSVKVNGLGDVKVERADVFLALTESGISSSVAHGENAGRTLRHTGVVRSLTRLVEIEAKRGAYVADLQLKVENNWKRHNTRAVIFVQDQKTRRIIGAAACSL